VESTPKKVWSGRFDSAPDTRSQAFTSSISFDTRLIQEDIRGSVAHVRMLGTQGIISPQEAAEIEQGLWLVWDEAEAGSVEFSLDDEDIHSGVERRLRELIGPVQGKLHTARSRNDQVITDVRLWLKRSILSLTGGLIELNGTLLGLASQHVETIMPGFTHTQRAQPVTLGHHLLAYVSMFERDIERFQQAYARLDCLALGSSALAGTTFPIDRKAVADDLGFAGITRNSLDAIGDRDPVIETIFCCAMVSCTPRGSARSWSGGHPERYGT
jgi:argininosuccinate lyase